MIYHDLAFYLIRCRVYPVWLILPDMMEKITAYLCAMEDIFKLDTDKKKYIDARWNLEKEEFW